MITAIIISAGITACLMEIDPGVRKTRKEKFLKKKRVLYLTNNN